MISRFNRLMTPRTGDTFRLLIATRISGGPNQKIQSNADQRDNCIEFIRPLTNAANFDVQTIECVAKGELLEREEIVVVEREIRTRQFDAFLVEDLGRLARDIVAKYLFGLAADHVTRAMAINDDVDTWDEGWEEKCLQACADHVGHNRHVSRRIKQKLRNRFRTRGELFQNLIAGYERVKDDGRCDMRRLSAYEPVIRQAAAMLMRKTNEEKR